MSAPPFSFARVPIRYWGAPVLLLLAAVFLSEPTKAQAPLHLVNETTSVREISFRFVGSQTFETERLRQQIATQAPDFFARLTNRLAFLPGLRRQPFLFDPVTLQKDVVRLRRFYQQNGFPTPRIDYPASQLDTTSNTIHVIFTVQKGPPLTIRSMDFRTAEGEQPVPQQLPGDAQAAWTDFRTRSALQTGERYTSFKRTQLEEDVRTWLRNQGFAFAEVQSTTQIDTADTAVDLRFFVDPGPLAYVSEIRVEGNQSVGDAIVLRELPFRVGDRFSAADVSAGQQQLFDLSLFRVALADVPEQPRDSTVVVRYRVRESKLRAYSGQVGYGTQPGVTLEGSWRHRNFQGNARTLVVGLIADTGYPENPPSFLPSFLSRSATKDPNRRFRASVTLRQPYLFDERLAGSLEPFVQERINPSLGADSTRFLSLNERQFGLNTQLTYDFLPFRSLSLRHSIARIQQFRSGSPNEQRSASEDDLFDRSVFSLSGTFGDADDFINPSRGLLVRPSLDVGGLLFDSGVNFVRASGGLSGYLPLSNQVELAGRLFGGALWPLGESRENLRIPLSAPPPADRMNRTYQDRFSEYLFYAGGGTDVRGWQSQLAGGKVLRRSTIARADYVYRPIGARLKLGANLEVRLPLPGLGEKLRAAAFVDAAYLDSGALNLIPPPNVSGTIRGPDGAPVGTSPSQLLVGSGVGARYQTPFGFVRLDLAYKLTPDALDLRRPGEVGAAVDTAPVRSVSSIPPRPVRRFRLHFGIGRSF